VGDPHRKNCCIEKALGSGDGSSGFISCTASRCCNEPNSTSLTHALIVSLREEAHKSQRCIRASGVRAVAEKPLGDVLTG
jgi:hypothetical protein